MRMRKQKEYDLWLKNLARDLTSMDPVTDAVSECVIDLLADVQEMYYDKENPWDPREHEELNYDKVDLIEIQTKNKMEGNSSKDTKDELLAFKNSSRQSSNLLYGTFPKDF